jgi:hypothetical protein
MRNTVVFGKLAKVPSEGNAPYAILVYAALLPWQFVSTSLTESSNSLILNANLVSKIYFLIVPAGSVITSLVDFVISFAILVGDYGLVSVLAGLASSIPAVFCIRGVCGCDRDRTVAVCVERGIPGLPLHCAVHCPGPGLMASAAVTALLICAEPTLKLSRRGQLLNEG